jgi:chromosome segregation protein
MRLKQLELTGFKSFAKKTTFVFDAPVTAIVGPNGSGKSNCAEAFRWVLGERSMKALRGAKGEDLIWNGTQQTSKANRAAVTLVFDNHDRKFNVDFDEVAVSREVYRDGTNSYLINGTAVRHRDIVELLANVSLGFSDHYIVHQGDADRILSANLRDRRAMIEDALGLRLYQWKIEESGKKLEKTEENIKQVESLRRELAPHLKFLKNQMEKVEQADRLRAELKTFYLEYLKREECYLTTEKRIIESEKAGPAGELAAIEKKLSARSQGEKDISYELKARAVAEKKDEISRCLGRLEARLEMAEIHSRRHDEEAKRDFDWAEVSQFTQELANHLDYAEKLSDIFSIKAILQKIRETIIKFLPRGRTMEKLEDSGQELAGLREEQAVAEKELVALSAEENKLLQEASVAREAEREVYELRARRSELAGRLNTILAREERWRLEEANFKREVEEGAVLVDQEIKRYREIGPEVSGHEERALQQERQKKIERIKIRLEDMGMENNDVMKEYQETTERDAFLAKEITDLKASASSLHQIINDLEAKIATEFKNGINKINDRFQEFFALMFGGGTARLDLVKEKKEVLTDIDDEEINEKINHLEVEFSSEEKKEGIEIRVNLPRKKVHGLQMLSGGERALTSIALLFAMSQVNPPPFLILDETDAALDEANSRKYGEMVSNLARHSQLILISHNRETMSRASIIYGVTMGADGVSKLLSIKFDEAAVYAK